MSEKTHGHAETTVYNVVVRTSLHCWPDVHLWIFMVFSVTFFPLSIGQMNWTAPIFLPLSQPLDDPIFLSKLRVNILYVKKERKNTKHQAYAHEPMSHPYIFAKFIIHLNCLFSYLSCCQMEKIVQLIKT